MFSVFFTSSIRKDFIACWFCNEQFFMYTKFYTQHRLRQKSKNSNGAFFALFQNTFRLQSVNASSIINAFKRFRGTQLSFWNFYLILDTGFANQLIIFLILMLPIKQYTLSINTYCKLRLFKNSEMFRNSLKPQKPQEPFRCGIVSWSLKPCIQKDVAMKQKSRKKLMICSLGFLRTMARFFCCIKQM